jgi:hypothetical protein
VRARDQKRTARSNEGFVEIGEIQCHIRAILPIKYQRKCLPVLEPQQNESGQSIRILHHMAHIASLVGQSVCEGPAHVVVTHPGEHRRLQSKPRRVRRNVARRTPKILGKAGRILQPRPDLLCVKVNGKSSKTYHIKLTSGLKMGGVFHELLNSQRLPTPSETWGLPALTAKWGFSKWEIFPYKAKRQSQTISSTTPATYELRSHRPFPLCKSV